MLPDTLPGGLQTLYISGCDRIRSLPEALPAGLDTLQLSYSGITALADTRPGRLPALKSLTLEIDEFPMWVTSLTALTELTLLVIDCPSLDSIGDEADLTPLTRLRRLTLHACYVEGTVRLPTSLEYLEAILDCPGPGMHWDPPAPVFPIGAISNFNQLRLTSMRLSETCP